MRIGTRSGCGLFYLNAYSYKTLEISQRSISMGTVHLTNGHHGLFCHGTDIALESRVLLDEAMLSRPILYLSQPYMSPRAPVIQAALRGLLDLRGFDAAVAYRVVEIDGVSHIALPHREWAEISLEKPQNVILTFSHDSRFNNRPYASVHHWLEKAPPHLGDAEFEQFCLEWSSPEKWLQFFQDRLLQEVNKTRWEADKLRADAANADTRATLIESALG